MAVKKVGLLFLFLALAEVTSWTIDLQDVRKHLFAKYAKDRDRENELAVDDENKLLYSNIVGNSVRSETPKYHEDSEYDNNNNYEGESYMEKKVYDTILNGSKYLEGLRRSIQDYIQKLERCNGSMTVNLTSPSLTNPSNMSPNFNVSMSEPPPPSTNTTAVALANMPSFNSSSPCEDVTKRSEHVRRLAALAAWTTTRLQDLAYASKYQKIDIYEENELILKLAWFLDRLAFLTGYEPEPAKFVPSTTQRPTTTSPTPFTLVPAPEPVKTQLMDCIKENSSLPATERCRYPLAIPPLARQVLNISDNSSTQQQSPPTESTDVIPISSSPPAEPSEILIASDSGRPNFASMPRVKRSIEEILRNPTPGALVNRLATRGEQIVHSLNRLSSNLARTPIVRIVNRIVERRKLMAAAEYPSPRHVRSIDNPMSKLMNYYYKHKVWEGSNPVKTDNADSRQGYDVGNHLLAQKHVTKRSLVDTGHKKHHLLTPLRNIKHFIKSRQRIHYNTYVIQKPKIISHLETIKHQINNNKIGKVELKKKLRKRSVQYGKMYFPRESVDPQGDISFYVKNKEGTNYNPSLVQAAQERLGLEQVFQTGNIIVVRRFGSNYNPLDPAPFYTGILRTMADA